MNVSLFTHVDKATFYKLAQRIEGRVEFVRGRIMQQTGATLGHIRIARRFQRILERQLDERQWFVSGADRAVESADMIRYPDVVVEPVGAEARSLSTTVPALTIEVLSPSSTDRDIDVKSAEYKDFPTLHAYIVASQDEPACFVWVRGADGEFPSTPITIKGSGEAIKISRLPVEIALAEVYQQV